MTFVKVFGKIVSLFAGMRAVLGVTAHDHPIGGQAVLEGVMMRGRRSWSLAVRRPSGGIARHSFPLQPAGERYPVLKLPVLRGVATLVESLVLGVRALGLSANLSLEESPAEEIVLKGAAESPSGAAVPLPAPPPAGKGGGSQQLGWREMAVTFIVALALAVVLFVVIPLAVVKYFEDVFSNAFVFNLVEGVIRIAIFLVYIVVISRIPDLRRVFEYHGAEHEVIHAYEAGVDLADLRAGRYSPLHPRCGTAFLLVVMVVAILVFATVGKPNLAVLVLSRVVGIPIVAGLAYEIIRYAGRHKEGPIARGVLWPGLALQRLTTREPSDDQVAVAVAALEEVLRVEAGGEPLPRGLVAT
ncbi:MAG: DUF1385 domain-containing protein [Thermoleophilia bacterium]|nr:DUF1385 domain-containing protein [Thermoleophilia bacterium]